MHPSSLPRLGGHPILDALIIGVALAWPPNFWIGGRWLGLWNLCSALFILPFLSVVLVLEQSVLNTTRTSRTCVCFFLSVLRGPVVAYVDKDIAVSYIFPTKSCFRSILLSFLSLSVIPFIYTVTLAWLFIYTALLFDYSLVFIYTPFLSSLRPDFDQLV